MMMRKYLIVKPTVTQLEADAKELAAAGYKTLARCAEESADIVRKGKQHMLRS